MVTELSFNAFKHGNATQVTLRISNNEILLQDDGSAFDTNKLKETNQSTGGNWTITRYIDNYPDVDISYNKINEKNETIIRFPSSVFRVNGLCEITLPKEIILSIAKVNMKHPNIKARYYYVDFSKFNSKNSILCTSGAAMLIGKLSEFCIFQDSKVFLYLPSGNAVWDDVEEKINVCLEWHKDLYSNKIQIIRGD